MLELIITENTYDFIINNQWTAFIMENRKIICQKKDVEYMLFVDVCLKNVDDIYRFIRFIYERKPCENNRWIFSTKEYPLSDEKALRLFLHEFEDTDNYPLRRDILSDIIENAKYDSVQQVRELAQIPFSGILTFDGFDMMRFFTVLPTEEIPKCIEFDFQDIHITNRYIPTEFIITKGEVNFSNCIIDGDIMISGSAKVQFSQCIITGKVTCVDASYVYLSSVNMKQFALYNSCLDFMAFEYSKIYRFIFHSCTVKKFRIFSNKFIEPYIARLDFSDTKMKIDMSQFSQRNINKKMIKKINKDTAIRIWNENAFYLNFLCKEPVTPASSKDIALDMVDTVLTHGNLEKEHHLYSDMMYKRALYSNTKWRRMFVYLTGAFYIPSRWIVYLVLNTVLFTGLYIGALNVQFLNITTSTIGNLDFWIALYFSICQVIGSNPTDFTPVGITQICVTIQSQCHLVKQVLSKDLCHKPAICWDGMNILPTVKIFLTDI